MDMFTKRPGEMAQSNEDPDMGFLGIPDVVRLPPELGGEVRRVLGAFENPCPCRGGHSVLHLVLDGGVSVAECATRGFLWYRTPAGQ